MGSCVLQIICELVACVILLSLHVSGNTNGSELLCLTSLKVPRNTHIRAPVMTELKINCTVIIHKCQGKPKISWCKIYGNDCKAFYQSNYIETMWKQITQQEGILFLMFLNISKDDAGLYRCKSQNSVSHHINVTVTAHKENSVSGNQSSTSYEINKMEGLQWFWPKVSLLVGLVVTVITVSLFIIRCQGRKSARKDTTTTVQYMKTQRSYPTTPSGPHHNSHPSA